MMDEPDIGDIWSSDKEYHILILQLEACHHNCTKCICLRLENGYIDTHYIYFKETYWKKVA